MPYDKGDNDSNCMIRKRVRFVEKHAQVRPRRLDSPGHVRVLDLIVDGIGFEALRELRPGQSCFVELRHRVQVASMEVEVRWVSAHRVKRLRNTLVPVFRAGGEIGNLNRDTEALACEHFGSTPPPRRPLLAGRRRRGQGRRGQAGRPQRA